LVFVFRSLKIHQIRTMTTRIIYAQEEKKMMKS